MYRKRAWRRYKNYTKAKRKRDIDIHSNWWNYSIYNNPYKPSYYSSNAKLKYGMYKSLHQYDKGKIHCSCAMCSAKTRNKGKRRYMHGNYSPFINYGMMDKRRQMAMDDDEKEFFEE